MLEDLMYKRNSLANMVEQPLEKEKDRKTEDIIENKQTSQEKVDTLDLKDNSDDLLDKPISEDEENSQLRAASAKSYIDRFYTNKKKPF